MNKDKNTEILTAIQDNSLNYIQLYGYMIVNPIKLFLYQRTN